MSSILKALKKLEHEKAARKPDSFRIDAEILRGGTPRRLVSMGASLSAIALFLCGVGATYLVMKHDRVPAPVRSAQKPIIAAKSEQTSGSARLPAPNVPAAELHPRTADKAISAPAKPLPSPLTSEKQQQVPRVKPVEIVPPSVKHETVTVSPPVPVARVVAPVAPVFKVNGIAFQDGADSVAVVNGITVSAGSIIEGAIVEEIQKDRVKFSRGGEKFVIILDKSN